MLLTTNAPDVVGSSLLVSTNPYRWGSLLKPSGSRIARDHISINALTFVPHLIFLSFFFLSSNPYWHVVFLSFYSRINKWQIYEDFCVVESNYDFSCDLLWIMDSLQKELGIHSIIKVKQAQSELFIAFTMTKTVS